VPIAMPDRSNTTFFNFRRHYPIQSTLLPQRLLLAEVADQLAELQKRVPT